MGEDSAVSGAPLVMVADDEIEVHKFVCEALEAVGFATLEVADGDELVELARRQRPACIVLDVMMPRMDGLTALARLRGHPVTASVPVVMLSGYTDPVYASVSGGIGATVHLSKPVSPGHLAETVRGVVASRAR